MRRLGLGLLRHVAVDLKLSESGETFQKGRVQGNIGLRMSMYGWRLYR